MLTVACVLRAGGEYTRKHVDRLQEMVSKNLLQPYKFTCLDNSPWPGYWSKISLFKPGHFQGRILYLDLDVTITGRLDDLADYPEPFVICRDWGRFGFNSSVMVWNAGEADRLYTDFTESVMNKLHGDQDWITIKKPDASIFPRDWCFSYRLGKKIGFPKDMRVCVYHGRPKSWDLPMDDLEKLRLSK